MITITGQTKRIEFVRDSASEDVQVAVVLKNIQFSGDKSQLFDLIMDAIETNVAITLEPANAKF